MAERVVGNGSFGVVFQVIFSPSLDCDWMLVEGTFFIATK